MSFFALGRHSNRFSPFNPSAKSRRELKQMRHAMNFHGEFDFRGFDNLKCKSFHIKSDKNPDLAYKKWSHPW